MESAPPFGAATPLDLEQYTDPIYETEARLSASAEPPSAGAGRLVKADRPRTTAVRIRTGQVSIRPGEAVQLGAIDETAVNRRVLRVLKNDVPGYVRIGHTEAAAQAGYELDAPTADDHGSPTEIMSAGQVWAFNSHATASQTVCWLTEYVSGTRGPITDITPHTSHDITQMIGTLDRLADRLGGLLGLLTPAVFEDTDK